MPDLAHPLCLSLGPSWNPSWTPGLTLDWGPLLFLNSRLYLDLASFSIVLFSVPESNPEIRLHFIVMCSKCPLVCDVLSFLVFNDHDNFQDYRLGIS